MKVERIYKNEINFEKVLNILIKDQIDQLVKKLYASDSTTTSHDEGSVQS